MNFSFYFYYLYFTMQQVITKIERQNVIEKIYRVHMGPQSKLWQQSCDTLC